MRSANKKLPISTWGLMAHDLQIAEICFELCNKGTTSVGPINCTSIWAGFSPCKC